ncbi:ATP-binding cassette domain-containing protein [Thioflexithrix psekupsensis]|uniref:ABC transporter n=1 Tax=Thioflexithrix psekupsensis TaxID=1570016 RepID=A0A251X860_9GAMM|nr:ATP-binding cassette domain-containing protein [Thioflexithrix psekupsensis]OUD14239.1 ABC transporter [Thioflexithrix psekupsensis]
MNHYCESVIQARNLTKCYGEQLVVNSINFQVRQGSCCGILGPNGAGKTTTLKMLVGHTLPTAGELSVLGYTIPNQSRQLRQIIGIVPQQDNLDPDFTVTQNLQIYGRYFGLNAATLKKRIPDILSFATLGHKANTLVTTLSGGMQRRLSLGRALINEPQLVVLDEPTTGLDPQARQLIWQRLRQLKMQGLTLILTTHYMEEAERLCDDIIVMDQGKILEQGAPQALIKRYIPPQVVEVHGTHVDALERWHEEVGRRFNLNSEIVGDTRFYYGEKVISLLDSLSEQSDLRYLHRPANLEDVFLKLTGRDLRDD